jgi:hypothetical protein
LHGRITAAAKGAAFALQNSLWFRLRQNKTGAAKAAPVKPWSERQ